MISHDFPGFPFPGGETTWALGNFFGSHMASIAPMAAVALWEEDSWEEEAKIAKELQGLALWAYACKWDFKAGRQEPGWYGVDLEVFWGTKINRSWGRANGSIHRLDATEFSSSILRHPVQRHSIQLPSCWFQGLLLRRHVVRLRETRPAARSRRRIRRDCWGGCCGRPHLEPATLPEFTGEHTHIPLGFLEHMMESAGKEFVYLCLKIGYSSSFSPYSINIWP